MRANSLTDKQTLKAKIRAAAGRCATIGALASVALLCAPFVNPPRREPVGTPAMPAPANAQSRIGVTLRTGDTLGAVLKQFGVAPPSAYAMIDKLRTFVDPKKFRPGDKFHVVLNPEDRTVEAMELVVDDDLVRVKATGDGWSAERQEIPSMQETRVIRGTIKGSLYESGVNAGFSPQHILDLAKIFEYDIDFLADLQRGDAFSAIVEERHYRDGRRQIGRILAAELEAEGETFDAFYYADKNGEAQYYDGKGGALRRSFLRAPLSYARISSPFSGNRMHPIFRQMRPHLAIDYAAPAGTPVVAIGKGRVEFVGWRNGYGNVVDVRHAGNYMSRYAHFSRFAADLRPGEAVDPGDVIGYVGQTGHATGPHLHFEFLRGDTKINFLDLRIPKNQQLSGEDLLRFDRLREQQLAVLRNNGDRVADSANKGL